MDLFAEASLSGVGTLSATAEVDINASSSLSGSGTLSSTAGYSISSSLSGSSTLSATPYLELGAASSLSGSAIVTPTAQVDIHAISSLLSAGSLSSFARLLFRVTSSLSGSSVFFATPYLITGIKTALIGRATRSFTTRRNRGVGSSLSGSGTLIPTAQLNILNYVATGGILISGEAVEEPTLAVTSSGGIVLGGSATALLSINLSTEGSGGIVLGGAATANIASSYEGNGGILIVGEATIQAIYRYVATGGILISGDSPEESELSAIGSGGIVLGGDATEKLILPYEGYGEIFLVGEAPIKSFFNFVQDVEWDVRSYFDLALDFDWDVGELPLKVYQVEGCCRPNDGGFGGCEVLPLDTNDALNCNQRFLQTIFARNLGEVCQFLTDTNWKWPICSIKKFSTEALDLIYDGTNKPPECNTLDEVEYCQIPECFEFCLQSDASSHVGVEVSVVENIIRYDAGGGDGDAVGGIAILGGYDPVRHVVGDSGIELSGDAEFVEKLSLYNYTPEGGIIVSGNANIVSSSWNSEAVGGIVVDGEVDNIVSSNWHYVSTGGIVVSGNAVCVLRPVYVSEGKSDTYPSYAGIILGGFAEYPILSKVSGGIVIAGDSTARIPLRRYVPTGGININGESNVISPYYSFEGSAAIYLGGEIGYNFLSLAYNVDDSVPITLGGEADNRNSILGDFWYTALVDDQPTLGGDAECRISKLNYIVSSNPNIVLGGDGGITSTYRSIDETHMGMGFAIEDLEVNYSLDGQPAPTLEAPTQTVNTTCGECNAVPLKLHFKHNLEFGAIFREFMVRNGHTIPSSFPLFYNRRSESWQSVLHYNGLDGDNTNQTVSWRINVDWTCTSQYADENFSSSVWKFSLLVTKRNITTNLDFDTRLLLLFPSEDICLTADRDGFDFSFQFDTKRKVVSTRQNLIVDVINLYDNIGLFKSTYWTTNKLNIRISEDYVEENLNKQDVTFIIPERQSQFAI